MCVEKKCPRVPRWSKLGQAVSVVFLLACVVATSRSQACDETIVRDAAFDEPRNVFRLCVIGQSNDVSAQQTAQRLTSWLETSGAGLNMEVHLVAADAPEVVWSDYGIPSVPPLLPVVALVGQKTDGRKSFVVDHWQPAPTDADLEVLRSSAARETIRSAVVQDLAVIVHVPGADNGHTKRVIEQVQKARSDAGLAGISVVQVARTDARERLLLAFANVPPAGQDWVGVVFGRGKFMAPLQGDEITESSLADHLAAISADCTCSQSPSRMGVDILMVWGESDDDSVVQLASSSQSERDSMADGTHRFASSPVELDSDSAAMPSLMAPVLWTVGGVVLISIVASLGIAWQSRQS